MTTIFERTMVGVGLMLFLLLVLAGLEVLGWLGMGMVGAAALGITLRADLFREHGNLHSHDVSRSISLKIQQDAALAQLSPMDHLRIEADNFRIGKALKAANAFFVFVTVIGFGMFFWDVRAEFMA